MGVGQLHFLLSASTQASNHLPSLIVSLSRLSSTASSQWTFATCLTCSTCSAFQVSLSVCSKPISPSSSFPFFLFAHLGRLRFFAWRMCGLFFP